MNLIKYLFSASLIVVLCHNLYAGYTVSEEWSTYVGGWTGNDRTRTSVIDANGNIYIGGYFGDGSILNDDGVEATTPPEYKAAKDGFVAGVNSFGVLQWYVALGAADDSIGEDDEVRGIAEFGQNVYAGTVLARTATNDDGTDAFLYSLSKTDGSVNWSYAVGEADAVNGFNAVTVDTNGNIYAVGYTTIAQIDPTPDVPGYQIGGTTYGLSLQGGQDAVVVKVSSSGTLQWVHYLGGANDDTALACTIGPDGYLYVGGRTSSDNWVSKDIGINPSVTYTAGFVVKLSTDGDHLWSAFLGGTGNDSVNSLAFESASGRLFAAGTTTSSDYMASRPRRNTYKGSGDGFVTSITDIGTDLTFNWSRFYGSTSTETLSSIRQLSESEMIVGGTTVNGTWLPDADNAYSGGSDGFVVVLQDDGLTNLWSTYTGGSDTETLYTIAARNGIFYAGGMTRSEGWVAGGFQTTWDKLDFFPEYPSIEFGFLSKYQSSGYLPDMPEITSQPQPVTVEEQQDALFSVTAVGTQPMFYQWKVNGSPVQDATAATFTLSTVQLIQNGDLISCTVSNIAGSVDSSSVLLTVTAIPNGWISIDISPANAVNAGAAWSIDSGSTWFESGDVVNVITGVYAITYKDGLFGWAPPSTPASTTVINAQTNTLSATYTEVFYTNYREISTTNVTVFVDPPDGTGYFVLTEIIPAGLTPVDYPPGTTWNSSTRKLTYFTVDTVYTEFAYAVTGDDGTYQVSGNVNFGEGSVTTAGPTEIVIGGEPPPVVPEPDITGFVPDGAIPGNYLLTFISIAGQNYLVETNSSPSTTGWAQQGQVSGETDQTTTSVPAPYDFLFYRVRTGN